MTGDAIAATASRPPLHWRGRRAARRGNVHRRRWGANQPLVVCCHPDYTRGSGVIAIRRCGAGAVSLHRPRHGKSTRKVVGHVRVDGPGPDSRPPLGQALRGECAGFSLSIAYVPRLLSRGEWKPAVVRLCSRPPMPANSISCCDSDNAWCDNAGLCPRRVAVPLPRIGTRSFRQRSERPSVLYCCCC